MVSSLVCAVCELPSATRRYEAMACNACASFFRRTSLAREEFNLKCDSDGTLEIRQCFMMKKCRLCRYRICEIVGMSKEAIHSYLSPVRNEVVIEEGDHNPAHSIIRNPPSPEIFMNRLINDLQCLEIAFHRLRCSTHNPPPNSPLQLSVELDKSSILANDFGKMSGWPLPYPKHFNQRHDSFIDNIVHRTQFNMNPENFNGNRKSWYTNNIIYSIEYLKAFGVLRTLSSSTRKALAAKTSIQCMNLSNAIFTIKEGSEQLIFPDRSKPYDGMEDTVTDKFKADGSFFYHLQELRLDDAEYVLLKALIVHSTCIDDASSGEQALLTKESEKFAKALLSYVLTRRGTQHKMDDFVEKLQFICGPRRFHNILSIIALLTRRTKVEKELHLMIGARFGVYKELCPMIEEIMLT